MGRAIESAREMLSGAAGFAMAVAVHVALALLVDARALHALSVERDEVES